MGFGVLLLALLALAAFRQSRQPRPVALLPGLTGQPEYCLTCHNGIEEISVAHPAEVFGCVRCHGGERLALDEELAHSTLRGGRNPSDLSVVEQNCGGTACHSGSAEEQRDHIARVMTSVQATYAGAIANVYFTFGAQPDLTARYAITTTTGPRADANSQLQTSNSQSPPESSNLQSTASTLHPLPSTNNPLLKQFQSNCLTCHLRAEARDEPDYHRLTGCAACHSPSNELGSYTGSDPTVARGESGHADKHRLTSGIPYTQCNACHNRGNYDLRTMTFNESSDACTAGTPCPPPSRLEDYYQPIAEFTKCEYELDCVDCHTADEVMGDGFIHDSKASIQYVQCRTCHGTLDAPPLTHTITSLDDLALRRAFLNPTVPLELGDTIVVTDQSEPLWSVRQMPDGSFQQVGKVTGQVYGVPLVKGSQCKQKPEEQASRFCHECHAVQR